MGPLSGRGRSAALAGEEQEVLGGLAARTPAAPLGRTDANCHKESVIIPSGPEGLCDYETVVGVRVSLYFLVSF